jgi:hypothetical protein
MLIYHEASPDSLEAILRSGLKRSLHGELDSSDLTIKTNELLDTCRPHSLIRLGVSRIRSIYGYLPTNTGIIDAYTGDRVSEHEKTTANHRVLLSLEVTASRCYVSDREAYEALKAATGNNDPQSSLDKLARRYWQNLIRLDRYKQGYIRRPEVMVTYDIPPEHITIVSN